MFTLQLQTDSYYNPFQREHTPNLFSKARIGRLTDFPSRKEAEKLDFCVLFEIVRDLMRW